MRRIIAVLAVTILATVAIAGPAAAEGNGTNLGAQLRLHFDGYCIDPVTFNATPAEPPITEGWTGTIDSPIDGQNSIAEVVSIPAATASCLYYVEAFTTKSIGLNVAATSLRNLSFEFRNTDTYGGGAPRFYVQMSDGSIAVGSAEYCDNAETARPSWSRADFTGEKRLYADPDGPGTASHGPGCEVLWQPDIFTAQTPYASDGTHSAWANFAAAHPGLNVTQVVIVIDAQAVPGSTGGTYSLDRIAIPNGVGAPGGSGTGARLYNSSGTKGVKCTTEASC